MSTLTAPSPRTTETTAPVVLEANNVTMRFGGLLALSDVKLKVHSREIVALIGPNGAGKTTLFNCMTNIYTPTSGYVQLTRPGKKPKRLSKLKPHEVTALGMARTFQNIRLFSSMTVLENVMIARHCRTKAGFLGALFRPPHVRREERDIEEKSYHFLKYMGLEDVYDEEARNLSYGQQRRLEIARALATEPFMLLLDEPAAGMNPQETLELKGMVQKIRDEFGLSILLIEHDMNMVMSVSDRIYVVEYGMNIADGKPEEVRSNPAVIKAYLGEEHA